MEKLWKNKVEQAIDEKLRLDYERLDLYIVYILLAHLPFAWFITPMGCGTYFLGGIPALLVTAAAILLILPCAAQLLLESFYRYVLCHHFRQPTVWPNRNALPHFYRLCLDAYLSRLAATYRSNTANWCPSHYIY